MSHLPSLGRVGQASHEQGGSGLRVTDQEQEEVIEPELLCQKHPHQRNFPQRPGFLMRGPPLTNGVSVMSRILLSLTLALLVAMGGACAKSPSQRGNSRPRKTVEERFAVMDVNKDGKLSLTGVQGPYDPSRPYRDTRQ